VHVATNYFRCASVLFSRRELCAVISVEYVTECQGLKNPGFKKKPNPAGFLGFNGFY